MSGKDHERQKPSKGSGAKPKTPKQKSQTPGEKFHAESKKGKKSSDETRKHVHLASGKGTDQGAPKSGNASKKNSQSELYKQQQRFKSTPLIYEKGLVSDSAILSKQDAKLTKPAQQSASFIQTASHHIFFEGSKVSVDAKKKNEKGGSKVSHKNSELVSKGSQIRIFSENHEYSSKKFVNDPHSANNPPSFHKVNASNKHASRPILPLRPSAPYVEPRFNPTVLPRAAHFHNFRQRSPVWNSYPQRFATSYVQNSDKKFQANFNPLKISNPLVLNSNASAIFPGTYEKLKHAERPPVFKYKKNNNKKVNQRQSASGEKLSRPKKPKHRHKITRANLWKQQKKEAKTESQPLLSFQRTAQNSIPDSNLMEISDSEEDCSSIDTPTPTPAIDDSDSASDSEDESDESEVGSEFSVGSELSITSSIQDKIIGAPKLNFKSLNPSVKEAFIAVFWDIENCILPPAKSAIDFVKYIRDEFYEGRTETDFIVVCDVINLNKTVATELHEAAATLIHMSSKSKNAADKKIQSYFLNFQVEHRNSNSAIVLISGDSDFSTFLCDMRYKHHIHINLICKKDAKQCLMKAAQKCLYFEDVIKQLPDKSQKDSVEYSLIVSNFPECMKWKAIKSHLSGKMKHLNCRIRKGKDLKSAEIIFLDKSIVEKAVLCFKDYAIGSNRLSVISSEIMNNSHTLSDKSKSINSVPRPTCTNVIKSGSSKEEANSSSIVNENASKEAILFVVVNKNLGNVNFWKTEFEKAWKISDFALEWYGKGPEAYFIITFKSLSKAQKVQKILQKNQKSDPSAPKFLKLVKQDKNLGMLSLNVQKTFEDVNSKRVENSLNIIEAKKEHFLKKHQKILTDIKKSADSQSPGTVEYVSEKIKESVFEKIKEFVEQKNIFLNFTDKTVEKLNSLSISSENLEQNLDCILRDYSRECNCISLALPIYAKKDKIVKTILEHRVVIIRAETGSGKSTQLPQYIWRENAISSKGMVICTQPRKIAAISLAKHVSLQVGCRVGDIVGYQVGLSSKKSSSTGILFVTDFTMLKMLLSVDMKHVACIIVDEAHERSIYTDILLGILKKLLNNHSQLKLVITSATIDVSIFRDYFHLSNDSVLQIAGRTFPVEDVWLSEDVALGWDYFTKTVETAYEILDLEPGGILAFLTTPLETEKAARLFIEKVKNRTDKKNVKIYHLHGKLDVQEQQQIFEKTPDNMCKVVFSTNCAETSITIPGIKYVVDCGMVKELQYDATRNMNVLSVVFISRSSAEQRKGRAGRTQAGRCFHMYSKHNYECLTPSTDPEILRTNLGQAILKLIKMGVQNPVQFDFLQSPPKKLLDMTMQQLIHLEAINQNDLSLTKIGEQMSFMPLEPRLSYLIFKGTSHNIGFEALCISSLITVSRSIFFRNSENKNEADMKKRRFCESESDFLTYLEVYKEWASVPKKSKSQWCMLNSINGRSMAVAHELINELTMILQKELNIIISAKFSEDSSVRDLLLHIVFDSFSQNICIFSGHHKLGYRSLNIPGELMIHPSSSLYTFGHWRPQYLVYDTVLKTTQTYLINVSPVTRENVVEAISNHKLRISMGHLENLMLKFFSFAPIGEVIILRDFIGKKGCKIKALEHRAKELGGYDTVIDVNISKGEVMLFGSESRFEDVKSMIHNLIMEAQEKMFLEVKEINIFEDVSGLTAVLAAGAIIKEVVLLGEFRDVKVTFKGDVNISRVVEKLQVCGRISCVREWKNYYKITFDSPVSAKQALKKYENDPEFCLQSVIKNYVSDYRSYLYKVFASFSRRHCTGEAFITFEPSSSLVTIVLELSRKTIYYDKNVMHFSISKKSQDIRVIGLPKYASRFELEKLITSNLSECVKITKCVIVRIKPYESSKSELESVKQNLITLFSKFSSMEKIQVDLKKPTPKDFMLNAMIFFVNSHDGESTVNALRSSKLPDNIFEGLLLKPELQTYLYCKQEVFSAVQEEIKEVLKFFANSSDRSQTLKIVAVPKENDNVEIKITSNNIADITDARRSIYNILKGDQIKCSQNPSLEKLFTSIGRLCLDKLSAELPNCYINYNFNNKTISLFGSDSVCNKIKIKINSFLCEIENENCKEISLISNFGKPGVLRMMLQKYGHDLQKLKEDCKLSEIRINPYKHIMTVTGSPDSISKVEDIIENLRKDINEPSESSEDLEICPVCADTVSDQKRLEYCGHAYCKDCLLHLLQNSEEFPLSCVFCNSLIVLADVNWALKQSNSLEKSFYKKLLKYFVQYRADISYCPSPDCPMIFRVTENEDDNIFECPVCCNSICTRCGELYHYGMSCSLYQCTKSDDDYSLKIWLMADPSNRKICPSCSAPIEKNGGCNHMTCWKCKNHMCWLCLQIFPSGDLVYNHQAFCPKNQEHL